MPDYPTCTRHLRQRKDTRLRDFFMCDGCALRWTRDAFADNAPLYVGEAVHGFCLLCNQAQDNVRLRQWFLCDICDRVARSIGRNHVAEKAIMDFWRAEVEPRYPGLLLVQNDPSELRPRRENAQAGVAPMDFHIRRANQEQPLAAIENKTGR